MLLDEAPQLAHSRLLNIIVWATRLMEILFGRQIVLSNRKKMVKGN